MSEIDQFIGEFLAESYENLDLLDEALVALESNPSDCDGIASIFRTVHTLKGSCGFLDMKTLQRVTHTGEGLLCRMRNGEVAMNGAIADTLLAMADVVRAILADIEASGSEGDRDCTELIERLECLRDMDAAEIAKLTHARSQRDKAPAADGRVAASTLPDKNPIPPKVAGTAEDEKPTQGSEPSEPARSTAAEPLKPKPSASSAVRVDVKVLDQLVNLVGELVLSRNQLLQTVESGDLTNLAAATQRLDMITMELQEGVMMTRMQPVSSVWNKFPRFVRDIANTLQKQVVLVMEGTETELDKTLLQAIGDPLTHLVRNAIDHGLEPPADRIAGGKPAEGTLVLRAFHEGGQVIIEISDDGQGLDHEKIRSAAFERGLLSRDQILGLSDKEAANLIFLPGFSTADSVTNISGRGVGMDVVRTNIERIGGSVDLHTTVGEGTTVRVKIPLTLAIVPALMISSDDDRFAIPQASLIELVRLEPARAEREIEFIHGSPVFRLRGRLLPLVDLRALLQQTERPTGEARPVNLIVLQSDGWLFGLIVDEVHDSSEIVVKPLGAQLQGIEVFAGATVMGDGSVALILDVVGLAKRSGVHDELRPTLEPVDGQITANTSGGVTGGQVRGYLVFAVCDDVQMAVALDDVSRLEKIPRSRIERRGVHEVVQNRSGIMPLIHLTQTFGGCPPEHPTEAVTTLVHKQDGLSVGLVMRNVLDVVDAAVDIESAGARPGIMGSAVLAGRVTEILDTAAIIRSSGALDRVVPNPTQGA